MKRSLASPVDREGCRSHEELPPSMQQTQEAAAAFVCVRRLGFFSSSMCGMLPLTAPPFGSQTQKRRARESPQTHRISREAEQTAPLLPPDEPYSLAAPPQRLIGSPCPGRGRLEDDLAEMAEYTTKRLKELEAKNSVLEDSNDRLKRENKLKQEEVEFWERSSQQQSSSARSPAARAWLRSPTLTPFARCRPTLDPILRQCCETSGGRESRGARHRQENQREDGDGRA